MDRRNEIDGTVIIVTGGTGGIGRATCMRLAQAGALVAAIGTDERRLDELSAELARISPRSIALRCDLGDPDEWSKLIATVESTFGRIDALVNCIGTLVPGSFERLAPAEIEHVTRTNFLSVLYGTRAVLPGMKRQGRGHIVNVGSLGSIIPMPFEALYSATKFALRGFTLSLSEELRGTGVHVSLISPGPVRTRMLEAEATDRRSTISFITPPLEPDDVAQAIVEVLIHPKTELILPRGSGRVAAGLIGLFPAIFGPLFRLAAGIGRRRLLAFRIRQSILPHTAQEGI